MSNDTQHTPGPWKAGNSIGSGAFVITLDDAVDLENGEQMGDVIAHHIGAPLGNGDPNANARLIAAGPELLEAAEAVMQTDTEPCTCGAAPYGPCSYCGPFDKLRAAIAKAKGDAHA